MILTREQKNSLAYDDCANYDNPTMPDDEVYMELYHGWRNIAQYPEDIIDEWEY